MLVIADTVYAFSYWNMIGSSSGILCRLLLPRRGSIDAGLARLGSYGMNVLRKNVRTSKQILFCIQQDESIPSTLFRSLRRLCNHLRHFPIVMPQSSVGIPIHPAEGGGGGISVPLSFMACSRFLASYSLVVFPWSILAANLVAAPWFRPR